MMVTDEADRQRALRARNRTLFAVVAAVAVLLYALTWLRILG
jgi:asparagine N-glycosylation enzyme membrane subunit Stt3